MDELDYTTLGKLKEFVEKTEKVTGNPDTRIGMEILISAFFPNAYGNLKGQMAAEYIRGFQDGIKSISEDDGK